MARKVEKPSKAGKARDAGSGHEVTETAPSALKVKSKSHAKPIAKKQLNIADKTSSSLQFYLDDYPRTLFPLATNKFLIENGEKEIQDYIRKCLDDKEDAFSFSPQKRVYASKPGGYLRRTVKLDVAAEYYLYDLIFRNRGLFRKPHGPTRTHYGYRFEGGVPIAATQAYRGFKGGLAAHSKVYEHSRGMDVATYFNSIYHHDVVSWFHELGAPHEDAEGLGQLLREIVSGRSIDCLPQGLYPTKMIGNDLLRFVDDYHDLKSEQMIRFMDDMYVFSDEERNVEDDFQTIQRLIGDKGLSINPYKSKVNDTGKANIDDEIDEVKKRLLRRRRIILTSGYDEPGGLIIKNRILKFSLSEKEMSYVNAILEKTDIEEEDAELILTIMQGHAHTVEKRLPYIISSYPHLAKNVYSFCSGIPDKEAIAEMILTHSKGHDRLTENQLFWFCATLADQLMSTSRASALISVLFNHRSATPITKAKILEIADSRFGLLDLRNGYLMNGQSDWLAWASAVGSRASKPATRNHKLKYFGKASQMNHLVANIMLKCK